MSKEHTTEQGDALEATIDQATEAVAVQSKELDELLDSAGDEQPLGISNLMGVPVRVTVQVGRARISIAELVQLKPGSVMTLDREAHEPADILVNGRVVASGEVVTVGSHYGVRITDVRPAEEG
ncbi:MAG: flagellar motor switch protein FliN [Planctomycetes bacterium]|jgi:flagellar motor switch protein FliN/FliY|nr:flagellar motor switch protein FliN [Planctomycetota bacterium]